MMKNNNLLDILIEKYEKIHCFDCNEEITDKGNYIFELRKVYCATNGKIKKCGEKEIFDYLQKTGLNGLEFNIIPLERLKIMKKTGAIRPQANIEQPKIVCYLKHLKRMFLEQ